jgi:GTP diphosphokinase / guanosine-3',5'-bis(diphosphate) 3'-diphosphatase
MQWNEFRSHIRHLQARDLKRVEDAFELGKKMHEGQVRKSGEPYFVHPIAVSHMLADLSADGDTIIAALLHDTVEDTPLTLQEIDHQFDGEVATLIDGVTKLCSKDIGTSAILNEQIESLRKIFTLMQQDVRIMVIKLYDRLHNMQTVEFLSQQRRTGLAQETFDVFVKIADRLCMQDVRDDLEGLCYSVLFPTMYGQLVDLRLENEWQGQQVAREMRDAILGHTPRMVPEPSVRFEHKSWEQLLIATNEGGIKADPVSDVTMVFVTDTIENCYSVLGILHQLWQRQMQSFQDFINAPSVNGYRGVHTTVILPDGTRVRCKIRTQEMHEYARQGITTLCFTKREEVPHILKWTQRISPLSSDTEGSSDDFWQSLKSEILGESIIIHGPGDETVQLPKGATALDGAFYIYQKEAVRTASIRVNGVPADFKTPLQYASLLEVAFSERPGVTREWLDWTKTGVATAHIHAALAAQPPEEKKMIGRLALQQLMNEKDKGLLEEFNTEKLSNTLTEKGFGTIETAYIGIAEGRVKPADIMHALFSSPKKNNQMKAEKTKTYEVSFSLQKKDSDQMRQFMDLTQKHSIKWRNVYITDQESQMIRVWLTHALTNSEVQQLEKELAQLGAVKIESFIKRQEEVVLLLIVIALWGLNPVFAKWFLDHDVTFMTLLSMRMMVFCISSLLFFIGWKAVLGRRLSIIPNVAKLAILPTLATIALATFTYQALFFMPPSVHLTIIRFNVLLLPALQGMKGMCSAKCFRIVAAALMLLSGYCLVSLPPDSMTVSAAFSLLALVSYMFYSTVTEHTLHENKIGLRYPYLLSAIGLMLGIFGVILLPFTQLDTLRFGMIAMIALYVMACVFIPHACYHVLLNRRQSKRTNDLFFMEAPMAVIAEVFLLGIVLPPSLYLLMGLALAGMFAARLRRKTTA